MDNFRKSLASASTNISMLLAEEHKLAKYASSTDIAFDQNNSGPCNINHSLPANTEDQTDFSSLSLEGRQERMKELALLIIELYQTSKRLKDEPVAHEEAA